MDNIENNKIIAEFMGYEIQKDPTERFFGRYKQPLGAWTKEIDLAFHHDWNWLMEVVEKIQSIPSYDKDKFGTIVKIEGRNCSIKSDNYGAKNKEYSKSLYFNANYSGNSKLEAVYKACFEYVKWYNEQKA